MLSATLISLWIIIIPRRARTAVHARTRVPSPRRAAAVAREFDDGITSHWFPVYNTPEINVRSVGPPVNTSPHDGYARLIYLYVNPATLRPIDTPDIARPDTPFMSLRAMRKIFMRWSRNIVHRIIDIEYRAHCIQKLSFVFLLKRKSTTIDSHFQILVYQEKELIRRMTSLIIRKSNFLFRVVDCNTLKYYI